MNLTLKSITKDSKLKFILLPICSIIYSCSTLSEKIAFKSVNHIQNPKKRNYIIKKINLINPWDGTRISGELTYPYIGQKLKLIVLISGHSGGEPPSKKDYEITGHKYFLVLSHLLTNKGYAVLRYDNRGVRKSSGDWTTATDEDYASDAAAVLQWARKNVDFNIEMSGFLGHSQGGYKAPLASLKENPDFMIMMGSGTEILAETMIRQNTNINHAIGIDDEITEQNNREMQKVFKLIKSSATYNDYQNKLKAYTLKSNPDIGEKQLKNIFTIGMGSVWWYNEAFRNIKPIILNYDKPILELFGEKDLLVSSEEALPTGRLLTHPKSKVHVFKDLNHLFQRAKKGTGPYEYWEINTTIEPEVIDYIDQWLKQLN